MALCALHLRFIFLLSYPRDLLAVVGNREIWDFQEGHS